MKNYQNIPTEDWSKYRETTPKKSSYYLTTYFEGIRGSKHSFDEFYGSLGSGWRGTET